MNYNFLIYISYSYALPIGIPLEDEIIKHGYTVKWFADHEEGKRAIQYKKNSLQTIQDVIYYKPDIVLTATDSVPDFITGLKVQVFHGFNAEKRPTKNNTFAHFRLRGFFDLYCTQGPNTTKYFELLAKKHSYFEVVETGWSKVDPLFPIINSNVKEKSTIMIASTFTERLSLAFDNNVYNEIKKLRNTNKYLFLMVLHPKLPKSIVSKWQALENDNFSFYNTTNLIPLFQKADLLFADTTSAIQEFLLQRKPVVTFNHTIDHNYLINIKESNLIESAFIKALTFPQVLKTHIDSYIKQLHPFNDGKSSERIIHATISYLHKDKSHLKSKPLNLIRKFKMRKKLNYFTFNSFNKPFTIPNRK